MAMIFRWGAGCGDAKSLDRTAHRESLRSGREFAVSSRLNRSLDDVAAPSRDFPFALA